MVTQPTPKHHFLRVLHELLKPATYLEIGVQSGTGMAQVLPTTAAIGVDPEPWGLAYTRLVNPATHQIVPVTSDAFFADVTPAPIDFAFIDGMHLIEYVLRDFANCEERSASHGAIVVDDVLPYSAAIATREPLPGDWTGDVWKLWPILAKWRPDLHLTAVNVEPTGLLVVQGLDPVAGPATLREHYDQITFTWVPVDLARDIAQPDPFTTRVGTLRPDEALKTIAEFRLKGN